jgi:MFS family permease
MMFLLNMSYLMVYSYSAVYIKSILGASTVLIGIIEGTAEGLSYILKLFSGILSDFFKKRKSLMIVGMTLNVTSRIIFGFFASFSPVLLARFMERVGNGTYSTPRDTIVADITLKDQLGKAYGLKRSLAQAGAVFGCLAGIFAMTITENHYQTVFKISVIPAVIAFLILLFFVKEPKKISPAVHYKVSQNRIKFSDFKILGQSFWLLMMVVFVFMLSRFGESFLMIHAKESFQIPEKYISVVMLVFNGTWCLASYPIGVLGDRMNRYWLLAIGIVFLVISNLLLATSTTFPMMLCGVACWGIQYGITLNIFLSLIARIVPEELRGTAFGFYYIICATSVWFADTLFGKIAHTHGMDFGFLTSGVIGAVSLLILIGIMGYKKKNIEE